MLRRDDLTTPELRMVGTIVPTERLAPPSRVCYGASGALLGYAVKHGEEAAAERICLHVHRRVKPCAEFGSDARCLALRANFHIFRSFLTLNRKSFLC